MDNEFTDVDFNRFRDLIYEEAGISLNDTKKALVRARLTKRMRYLPVSTWGEYYTYLVENRDTELSNFINAITTNKTDFFRENKHFQFMNDVMLPELVAQGKKKIRIWSAGCSTGEEPYSIAMTVHSFFTKQGISMPDVKILATDIDTTVLETGAQGIYKHELMEGVESPVLRTYFKRGRGENNNLYMVKDFLKEMIYFRRLNLQKVSFPMKGNFDAVFCRNVVIYFDKDTQRVLFDKIARYINEGDYLFIGHSENLTSMTEKFKLLGNTIYQRSQVP
jgi:chemotaxis protein methyltransferase CheR